MLPIVRLDTKLTVGNLLESLTIAVSISALVFSWAKDRTVEQAKRADEVREAAAVALTKLDRWQSLHLALYDELQPQFIDTSEGLSSDFAVTAARDELWKQIVAARARTATKALDEQISTAYIGLVAHSPRLREQYRTALADLDKLERNIGGNFLEQSQNDVMAFDGQQADYTSAKLGNALRATAWKARTQLEAESSKSIDPLRSRLLELIGAADEDLLTLRERD